MKNSKTTMKELSRKYRLVLKECLFLNLMIFALVTATGASAEENILNINDSNQKESELVNDVHVVVNADYTFGRGTSDNKLNFYKLNGMTVKPGKTLTYIGDWAGYDDNGNSDSFDGFLGMLSVENDATFNMRNANLIADKGVTVSGQLNLSESVLEAGNDDDIIPAPGIDMNLDNANVVLNASDLEATGAINIKDSLLQIINANDHGLYASQGDISLNNSIVEMGDKSYLSVGGHNNIAITNGARLNMKGYTGLDTEKVSISASTIDLDNNLLNVKGELDIQDNSTVNFRVSGKDTYGKVEAGKITISNQGTNLNLTLDSGVLKKDETKIFNVLNAGTIDGSFANLSQNARYEFKDVGNGQFEITGKETGKDIIIDQGGTTNDQKVAEAWIDEGSFGQGTAGAKVADHLNNLSQNDPRAFADAVKALKPDSAPTAQATAAAINNQISGAVGGRFGSSSVLSGGHGRSGGDVLEKVGLWAQGLFDKAKLDKSNGFDGKTYGLALGFDGKIAKDFKLGFGYAYTNSDINATGRDTDTDTHTAIVYGEKNIDNAYVNGIITYGWSDYSEDKNVGGLKVKADYDVNSLFAQLMGGYNYKQGFMTITPETGARYLRTKSKSYTDTAGQQVEGDTTNTVTGVLGFKVAANTHLQSLKNVYFKPEFHLHGTYDIKNDKGRTTVILGNGSSYVNEGEALKRFGIETGVQFGIVMGNVEVSLDYEGKFRSDYTDHIGLLNVKYNF